MFEKWHGYPEENGQFWCVFTDRETGIDTDKRKVWFLADDRKGRHSPLLDNYTFPVTCNYTPIPGTKPEEWKKSGFDDEGIVLLMKALIRRAQKDYFSKDKRLRASARWFLDTKAGHQWAAKEERRRNDPEFARFLAEQEKKHKRENDRHKDRLDTIRRKDREAWGLCSDR